MSGSRERVNRFDIVESNGGNGHNPPYYSYNDWSPEAVFAFMDLGSAVWTVLPEPEPLVTENNGQVFLIPGRKCPPDSLSNVTSWLQRGGLRPHCATVEITEYPQALEEITREMLSLAGDEPLTVIGFSLGGTLAEEMASDSRLKGKINKIITVASPHTGEINGTPIGRARTNRELPPGITHIIIASSGDTVVPMKYSLTGTNRDRVVEDASHFVMTRHPKVFRHIADALTAAPQREAA